MENQYKIALLIDAENVSNKYIKLIMDEVSEYGTVTYKRVFGDFSAPSVMSWKENLMEYAMTPVFQFNYTRGKNASDSAMVIDAMDILYSGKVNGFCLVTSDSDFTKLAIRLREAGMFVVGMGERKSPNSLISACDTFKFLDILFKVDGGMEKEGTSEKKEINSNVGKNTGEDIPKETVSEPPADAVLVNPLCENNVPDMESIRRKIKSIIDARSDESGWMNLSLLGNVLLKRVPGFDHRNYGYKKLRDFIEGFDCFEIHETENLKNNILKVIFIKNK